MKTVYPDNGDRYGNNCDNAANIEDILKPINGKINTDADTDYIKFTAPESGSYTFTCISSTDINSELYDNSQTVKAGPSSDLTYSLTAGEEYYLKISGNTGEYILNIISETSENDEFNIYEYDKIICDYKEMIWNICKGKSDITKQKELYEKYEKLISEDKTLHVLPDIITNLPKGSSQYDTFVNEYYKTKYTEFINLKDKYIDLLNESMETEATLSSEGSADEKMPGGFFPQAISIPNSGDASLAEDTNVTPKPAALEIEEDKITSTTVTIRATFPISGKTGNAVHVYDFNTEDGLTLILSPIKLANNKNDENINMVDGEYKIEGLTPGGFYEIQLMWGETDEDNCTVYGGQYSIIKRVQLKYATTPPITRSYEGKHIKATPEEGDRNGVSEVNFDKWINRMDTVYETLQDLTGHIPDYKGKIEIASSRDDFNTEQPNGMNYWRVTMGKSGFPITISHPFFQSNMRRLSQDDWGDTPIHELCHEFDNDSWVFDAEALAYLKVAYVLEKLNAKVYRVDTALNPDCSGWYTGAEYYKFINEDWFEGYSASFGAESSYYLPAGLSVILLNIEKETGWDAFKQTFSYFNKLSNSQIPGTEMGKLNLFLTKIGDYSQKDVFSMISDKDKEIINARFNGTLQKASTILPIAENSNGRKIHVDIRRGFEAYQFKPSTAGEYTIYTSPYGETGNESDTYIEIYDNAILNGVPLASSDDYGNVKFSKVLLTLKKNKTYYIKIENQYPNRERVHADLNIEPHNTAETLTLDTYKDISVSSSETKMFSFTPGVSGEYTFTVDKYLGEVSDEKTYIKLYDDADPKNIINHNYKKIIEKLEAGRTYYLLFSGFMMCSASGRISVREVNTLEFKKRTDSNFIYVNNPEYITNMDIVDDSEALASEYGTRKIFEQKDVSGKNTYYETHITHTATNNDTKTFPKNDFYVDVDFYNPGDADVNIIVSNLAYGTLWTYPVFGENDMSILQKYFSGGINIARITIPSKSHILLFDQSVFAEPDSRLKMSGSDYDRMCLMFDLEVYGGNITVSSLAAYNRSNLSFASGSENKLSNGNTTDSGEEIYKNRLNERDIYEKYKGIAKNQSAQIDADLDFVIDNTTESGNLKVKMKDPYYAASGVWGPSDSWLTEASPTFGDGDTELYAMPGNLHKFEYHYKDTNRKWYFDFEHRNLNHFISAGGDAAPMNEAVAADKLEKMKSDVANGINSFGGAPDSEALGMGEWGTIYHYTITVLNKDEKDRSVDFTVGSTNYLLVGSRTDTKAEYTFNYYWNNDGKKTPVHVDIPKGKMVTFEVVTLYGLSDSGLSNELVLH